MADRIELHPAFVWDCEDCGTENFVRAVSDFAEDVQEKLREEYGVEDYETGSWCMAPSSVTCKYCGSVFYALDGEADEDDDL